MGKNLRTFLEELEQKDLVINVSSEVDADENMGALNWEAVKSYKKAIVYDNIKGHHARKIYQKYQAMNKPMPVAIVVGHHGAVVLASTWTTGFGVDEYQIANVLLNEELELVKCKTQDIEVPADAEVVIEGEIPPDVLEEEGPFGEHSGCTIAGAGLNEIIKVTRAFPQKAHGFRYLY